MSLYNNKEAVLQLGEIDPQFAELLKNGGDEMVSMLNTIHIAMVTHAEGARQPLPGTQDSDREFDIRIPMSDGHENPARVFKPESPVEGRPAVIMIHGGGFSVGHPTHMSHYARAVAKLFGTTVVSITHRLTPAVKFPTPASDVWDSLEWIFSADDAALGGGGDFTRTGFIIGGLSAGASLSAVTAQKWVSRKKSPKLVGVWLSIPWIFERETVPEKYADLWLSREQNTDSLIINSGTITAVKAVYQPDITSPDFSPVNDENAHKGLPPVYFQVCGQDPLRDDGLIYQKVLADNGVSTKMDVYPGVPHGFAELLPQLGSAQKCLADCVKGFAWLFGVETPSDADIAQAFAAPRRRSYS